MCPHQRTVTRSHVQRVGHALAHHSAASTSIHRTSRLTAIVSNHVQVSLHRPSLLSGQHSTTLWNTWQTIPTSRSHIIEACCRLGQQFILQINVQHGHAVRQGAHHVQVEGALYGGGQVHHSVVGFVLVPLAASAPPQIRAT